MVGNLWNQAEDHSYQYEVDAMRNQHAPETVKWRIRNILI